MGCGRPGSVAGVCRAEMCVVDVSAQSLAARWLGIIHTSRNFCGGNTFGLMVVLEITQAEISSLIWSFK